MANTKQYEYRFILPTIDEGSYEYKRGTVIHKRGGDIFHTIPANEYEEPEEYPIESTRREQELSEKEILDVLMDWDYSIIDGKRKYNKVSEITKDLREYIYDDTQIYPETS